MVMMPASTGWMRSLVCKSPVVHPASAPASSESGRESSGCPAEATTAATAAPKPKLPSQVRSGRSRMRRERYTPSARRP